MKKLLILCLLFPLLLSHATAVSAASEPVYQKRLLVQRAERFLAAHPQTTALSPEDELALIIGCTKDDLSGEKAAEILNPAGIFQLNAHLDHADAPPEDTDVVLRAPALYWSAHSETWYVVMYGFWTTDDPWYELYGVRKGKLGGEDSLGFTFNDVHQPCPARMGGCGWMDDGAGHEKTSTSLNFASGDTGVGMDLYECREKNEDGFSSIGARFGCVMQYPASFTEFDVTVSSYYAHTWGEARITDITFPGDSTGRAQVSFSYPEQALFLASHLEVSTSVPQPRVPRAPVIWLVFVSSAAILLVRRRKQQ